MVRLQSGKCVKAGSSVWTGSPLPIILFPWASSTGGSQTTRESPYQFSENCNLSICIISYPNTSYVLAGNELWQLNITVQICFQASVKLSPFKMKAVYFDMMCLWGDGHTLGLVDAWLLINWLDCISARKMGPVRMPPFEYPFQLQRLRDTLLGSQCRSTKDEWKCGRAHFWSFTSYQAC